MKELLKLELETISGGKVTWIYGVAQILGGIGLGVLGGLGMFPGLRAGNYEYIVPRVKVVTEYSPGPTEDTVYVHHGRGKDVKHAVMANKPYLAYYPPLANAIFCLGISLVIGGLTSFALGKD